MILMNCINVDFIQYFLFVCLSTLYYLHHPYIAHCLQVVSDKILFLKIISSILTSVEEVGEIYDQM